MEYLVRRQIQRETRRLRDNSIIVIIIIIVVGHVDRRLTPSSHLEAHRYRLVSPCAGTHT